MGEVLPRFVARCALLVLSEALVDHLCPLGQFGVGVSCGAEVVAHGVAGALESQAGWGVLDLDVQNAFNAVERGPLFEVLRGGEFEGLIPFLRSLYFTPAALYWTAGEVQETLWSARGVRQGDPLGPALYSLAQAPVVRELRERCPGVRVVSYLDNTYLLGPVELLPQAFQVWQQGLGARGLRVRPGECSVYVAGGLAEEEAARWRGWGVQLAADGVRVAGVPVGSADFCVREVSARLQQWGGVFQELELLGDPQVAFLLLQKCVAVRPLFLCRTVRPDLVQPLMQEWDAAVLRCFGHLLGSAVLEGEEAGARGARAQVALPVRLGGFGLRPLAALSPASYVAS
jgi:hypothetical protein